MKKETITRHLPEDYPWKELLQYFDTIDSTNTQLKLLAKQGAPEGTVLVADLQTGGRGRLGRTFLSPPGVGIYLSMLLRPSCEPRDLMHLTCAVACALCDAVEAETGIRPSIKWTNDLVYGKRKLAGILTEMGVSPRGTVDWVVIGVGINCCQGLQDFPPEIQDIAGSLSMVTGKTPDRDNLAAQEMAALYRMSKHLMTDKEALLNQYRRDCITLGKQISVVSGDSVRHGTALDIDSDGGLIVAFSDGTVSTVQAGEVSVRGMYGYL